MELLDYLAKTLIISANIIVGVIIVVYFSIRMLVKYTDFGLERKKEKDKSDRIFNNQDEDLGKKEDLGFIYKKPKIETSFGDKRIGEIDDNPTQTQ